MLHRDCIGVALIISPVAGTWCLPSTRVFAGLLFRLALTVGKGGGKCW